MMVWAKVVAVWGDGYILKIEPTVFPDGEDIKCILLFLSLSL